MRHYQSVGIINLSTCRWSQRAPERRTHLGYDARPGTHGRSSGHRGFSFAARSPVRHDVCVPVPPLAELLLQLCISFVRSSAAGLAEFVSQPRQLAEAVDTTLLRVKDSIGGLATSEI